MVVFVEVSNIIDQFYPGVLVELISFHVNIWLERTRTEIKKIVQTTAVTKIQSVIRMHKERTLYWNLTREHLLFYKKCHVLVITCQRLWRGHTARAANRKRIEQRNLPNPNDPKYFDFWMKIQEESHPPIRRFGMYEEYVLSGAPRTWKDRRIKRRGIYLRDVKFYVHSITRRSYWENPSEASSSENNPKYNVFHESALIIQRWWRIRTLHKGLRLLAKVARIIRSAEKLHSSSLEDEAALYNFAFFTHVVLVRSFVAFYFSNPILFPHAFLITY